MAEPYMISAPNWNPGQTKHICLYLELELEQRGGILVLGNNKRGGGGGHRRKRVGREKDNNWQRLERCHSKGDRWRFLCSSPPHSSEKHWNPSSPPSILHNHQHYITHNHKSCSRCFVFIIMFCNVHHWWLLIIDSRASLPLLYPNLTLHPIRFCSAQK